MQWYCSGSAPVRCTRATDTQYPCAPRRHRPTQKTWNNLGIFKKTICFAPPGRGWQVDTVILLYSFATVYGLRFATRFERINFIRLSPGLSHDLWCVWLKIMFSPYDQLTPVVVFRQATAWNAMKHTMIFISLNVNRPRIFTSKTCYSVSYQKTC